MKKIILGAAVAFAAIFGGYTASQTSEMAMSELQVKDVEALADYVENVGVTTLFYPLGNQAVVKTMTVTTTTEQVSNTNGSSNDNTQSGNAGFNGFVGGSISHQRDSTSSQTGSSIRTTQVTKFTYMIPCTGTNGSSCTPIEF